jgi:hypothetical protein
MQLGLLIGGDHVLVGAQAPALGVRLVGPGLWDPGDKEPDWLAAEERPIVLLSTPTESRMTALSSRSTSRRWPMSSKLFCTDRVAPARRGALHRIDTARWQVLNWLIFEDF